MSQGFSNINVGILHSLSGTMASSEMPLKDAALMAIAEINSSGGILGKIIEPIIEDGASDPATFVRKAKKLIAQDKVATLFGCWTSATRKAVLPVLEQFNALLWYPVQYEGLECSPNIFYTGSCPNQQVEPAVNWLLQNKGEKFYLLGSDYVFPRTVNKLIEAQLKHRGAIVDEIYVPLGNREFGEIIARIQQTKPDVVFNTLNGDSNFAFYRQYKDAGITPDQIPIMAVSVAEEELQSMGNVAAGHYASWTYFQSLDTPNNRRFVENFQRRYGKNRVTSDPIEAAYTQVFLWKQAVESAGSFDVNKVRVAACGQTFEAPSGLVKVELNHHLWKRCQIGQILPNGQFEVVFSSDNLIKPLPWLGVEELNFSGSAVVISMLAGVSQGIQQAWLLEQKSAELEVALAQLQNEIAERQRVEAALRDSEAELRALFMAMKDLIIVFDRQGRYLKMAPTNPSLLLKPVAEQIGKTLYEVLPTAQADLQLSYIQRALDTQQTLNVEYSLTIADREVWHSASVSPLSENTVIWVVRDISDRKQAETALEESLAQLARANQEITFLNDRLKAENHRLSAELEVTRQLQQMILPKQEELTQIPGLEIAGFMDSAAEVGGDYYDVLNHNGRVKIGIGDVTGHGLESGVLMIMVQTAVRTLLLNDETNPVKFLNVLNRTIYENLQRMNCDKNLTLSLLDYYKGTLYLSGQHEEMIVVRSGGKVERIDTIDLGFPIGLEADIAAFVAQIQVKLNSGDVVVLYTDGITEAEDINGVQYGLERLCDVVSCNWQQSAFEIKQVIIEDVQQHIGEQKVYDDITLLVLKQK